MKVGILKTGSTPSSLLKTHQDYDEMVKTFLGDGFQYESFDIENKQYPQDCQDCDAWVITGSKHSCFEGLDWMVWLESFIQQIVQKSIPLVGICFGHQIIAQALGGKVVRSDKGLQIGYQDYQVQGFESSLCLLAWHQDQVVQLPPKAQVLGSSQKCPYAFIQYNDTTLSIQPHPEFLPHYVKDLIQARDEQLEKNITETALKNLEKARPLTQLRPWVSQFLTHSTHFSKHL